MFVLCVKMLPKDPALKIFFGANNATCVPTQGKRWSWQWCGSCHVSWGRIKDRGHEIGADHSFCQSEKLLSGKNLEKSDRAVRYQLVNLVGRTHITHILPGQNFCIIINCSRKFTIWQKPPHISNFSRCFPTKPDCLILTSNSMEISKINIWDD